MQNYTLTWLSEFRSRDLEVAYRSFNIPSDKRLNLVIAIPIVSACLLFLLNDISQEGVNWDAAGPRLVLAVTTLIFCWFNRTLSSWRSVYILNCLIAAAVMATVAWINWLRPVDFVAHIGVDVLVVFTAYLILPTIRLQFVFSWVFTLVLLILHFGYKEPYSDMAYLTVPVSLLIAHVLGIVVSINQNRDRRQLYTQMATERELRDELMRAREELKVLTSLIPMCAACKKIRNEDGDWNQVETYMQALSGSRISHSICPDCAETLYGEFAPSK